MTLRDTLDRFEVALRELAPDYADRLGPPAEEGAIERLRSSLAPYDLPEDVAELYRWHDGGMMTAFSGREFLPIETVISSRVDDFYPSIWLALFAGAYGDDLFVEATHPDQVEPYVWLYGKDTEPQFQYLSLESMFATLTESFHEGMAEVVTDDSGYSAMNAIDPSEYAKLTRRLNPVPDGVPEYRSFFPSMDWPASWLNSAGIDKDAATPMGLTTATIAEAIEGGQRTAAQFTVEGRIEAFGQGLEDFAWFSLRDDTGIVLVHGTSSMSPFVPYLDRVRAEADIEVGPEITRDPRIRDRYIGHPAHGVALRLYPPDSR